VANNDDDDDDNGGGENKDKESHSHSLHLYHKTLDCMDSSRVSEANGWR